MAIFLWVLAAVWSVSCVFVLGVVAWDEWHRQLRRADEQQWQSLLQLAQSPHATAFPAPARKLSAHSPLAQWLAGSHGVLRFRRGLQQPELRSH